MLTRNLVVAFAVGLALAAGCKEPEVAPAAAVKSAKAAQAAKVVAATMPEGAVVPAGENRLVNRPDEIITQLDSGMTVIVKRYAAAPVVSVRMHVKAGSIWEEKYVGAGISHLFEHLLHGGATAKRTEEQSQLLLDQIGASTNAFTSYDETVYFIDVPRQHATTAIDLLADWVTRPTFPEASVKRELGVVQRELERGEQEPDSQIWETANQVRYLVHPARFPVIGLKPALNKLTRDDILGYYKAMYVPARVVFAVVGDLDPEATLAAVKKEFADFTARPDRPITLPAEPPVVEPRTGVTSMDVAQVRFWVGFPTVDLLNEDLYPLDVMMYVLAAGESSRLRVELRDRLKLALTVNAVSMTPPCFPGTFFVSGVCLPANWPALREAILAEFDRLARKPVDADALAQAKRQALVEHIRDQQTAAAMASSLAANQLLIGDAHFDDQYVRRLEKVTAEQVQAAARKYFDRTRLLTALVVPRDYQAPAAPPQGPGMAGPGASAGQPAAGIVVSPVRKVVLDNGLTVLLRRNTAVPLVAIQMHFNGGLLAERADQNGICQLTAQAALRGTRARSAEQIFGAFERAGGSLTSNAGRNSFSFSASVLADQLPAVLPVFADVIENPAFPTEEVDKLNKLTVAAIQRVGDQLEAAANQFFFAKYFGNHPYGRPVIGKQDTVSKLTPADLALFHRKWVTGGNAVLAVFGDIDLDQTERTIRDLFGKGRLPASAGQANWPAAPAPPARNEFFVQPVKKSEAAEVDMGFSGASYTDADYYPLTLLDTMISGYNLPAGWLHETLRGRQLVYVVHALNIAWRQTGVFYIYAQCPPEKVRPTIDGINEQLERARKGELTEQMLVNAKATVIAAELMDLQTNDALAARCALDELLGRGFDQYLKLADRINAVTLADVNRVVKKYLTVSVTTVTTSDPATVDKK